mmetsp:Transcript_61341/g.150148  ORF Transcript_61341/g.150148 Transcript_61341/m.150148 type:complete len:106 (-) Transcript_61341:1738-2055(-)
MVTPKREDYQNQQPRSSSSSSSSLDDSSSLFLNLFCMERCIRVVTNHVDCKIFRQHNVLILGEFRCDINHTVVRRITFDSELMCRTGVEMVRRRWHYITILFTAH